MSSTADDGPIDADSVGRNVGRNQYKEGVEYDDDNCDIQVLVPFSTV